MTLESKSQHATNARSDNVLIFLSLVAPHLSRLDVGGTLVVGLGKHAHDGDEDLLDGLDG